MPSELRPYQIAAVRDLIRMRRANLWAEPGLGKTALCLEYIRRAELDRVLVIAPKMVATTVWPHEPARWPQFHDIEVAQLVGTPTQRENIAKRIPRVSVCNPEILGWLAETWGDKWPYTTVIFDECTRLRYLRTRGGASQVGALRPYLHTKIERWVGLSGTPTAEGYLGLWGMFYPVDAGASLGRSYTAFEQRWFMPQNPHAQFSKMVPKPGAIEELQKLTAINTIAIRAADHLPTGSALHTTIDCPLPLPGRRAYDSMKKHLLAEHNGGRATAFNAAALSGKLAQIASGGLYNDADPLASEARTHMQIHGARLEALRNLVDELQEPLAVVYTHRHQLIALQKAFPEAVEIHEKLAVERWNRGEIQMLLLHPLAAGHGVNLAKGGRAMCFYAPIVSGEQFCQIQERLGAVRQAQLGRTAPALYFHLVTHGTVDDSAVALREGKMDALAAFLKALA